MMFALGAASSIWDGLQSLTGTNSSSSTASAGQSQGAANPFAIGADTQTTQGTATTGFSAGTSAWTQISPQTMSALIDAQSQSGTANTAPTNPSDALQNLFSQIDGNGDGSISKSEFESALGAGGTNVAQADDVFGKLDSNGDGSVSLDELKNALQGAGGHHGGHHHAHASASSDSTDTSSTDGSADPNSDPLLQALAAASSSSGTNATNNGDPVSSLTAIDKSQLATVSLNGSSSPSSSYNMIQQALARAEQSFANSIAGSLSVNA
jgi:Ca2+-binding EF-hand superfamily protein